MPEHRGERPVLGMVYTHSHIDHFGGVKGIITTEDATSGRTQVIAPAGFMEAAVSENVFAGTAMARRAGYMYGAALPKGPTGQIGSGLGQTTSTGMPSLIAPTVDVTPTGQELVVDGVRIVFQLAPETEAPAEMHMFYPQLGVLNMAENACPLLHNFIPLRGAVARDPRIWAKYIGDAIENYAARTEILIGQHHWPLFGRAGCRGGLHREAGRGELVEGTYQSPILVQWRSAKTSSRKIEVALTRFD